jgi:hypothetical protein
VVSRDEISAGIQILSPRLGPESGLRIVGSILMPADGSDPPRMDIVGSRLVEALLEDSDDLHCEALILALVLSTFGSKHVDEETFRTLKGSAYGRLLELCSIADDGVLRCWIAAASQSLVTDLKPEYAAELQLRVLRLCEAVASPNDYELATLIHCLRDVYAPSPSLMRYLVPPRMAVVDRFRQVLTAEASPLLDLVEIECIAWMALADADDGRRQGVLFHESRLREAVRIFDQTYPTFLESHDSMAPDDQTGPGGFLGFGWDADDVALPIRHTADALLLVGDTEGAIVLLAHASRVRPYAGSDDDVALLRQVIARTRPPENQA